MYSWISIKTHTSNWEIRIIKIKTTGETMLKFSLKKNTLSEKKYE